MATLFDLEQHDTHNFIYTLIDNGETSPLKKMRQELHDARDRGDTNLATQYESHETEIGLKLKRFTELESDIRSSMAIVGMNRELAQKALDIFVQNPHSLDSLPPDQRKIINEYWVKKQAVLQLLIDKKYLFIEIFSSI